MVDITAIQDIIDVCSKRNADGHHWPTRLCRSRLGSRANNASGYRPKPGRAVSLLQNSFVRGVYSNVNQRVNGSGAINNETSRRGKLLVSDGS